MIIIDTNVLVDWEEYELDPTAMYGASVLSRAELEWGLRSVSDPLVAAKRIRKLRHLDATFDWIEFDVEASQAYGRLAADANGSKAQRRSKDALIAAQAYALGGSVMTRNRADFVPFERYIEIVDPVGRTD